MVPFFSDAKKIVWFYLKVFYETLKLLTVG